ncbi:NUDIX domain-containing protein [Ornithinibacillus sp. 179-J 7C1 HS]|uniref:NUDIX domain-containing protein n=1 Tax=Ornithinibacillus sp. 179-J 7C1 HS TaxID=3142384 RepID=UPI0039A2B13E
MDNRFHHLARGIMIKGNKLLVARAKGYQNTFLPGGHIEFGESAKDALEREIVEELGLRCTVKKFLGLVEHKWLKKGHMNCEINQLFLVEMEEVPVDENPQSKEDHIEFFWITINELNIYNLQPYPLRELIYNHVNGKKELWWASSLNDEIDHFNVN